MIGTVFSIFSLAFGLPKDSVLIKVIQDPAASRNHQVCLSITILNTSNQRFLLYSFKKLSEAMDNDAFYCDGDISAVNAVFLFDSEGLQKYITLSFNRGVNDVPLSAGDLRRKHEDIKKQIVNDRIVLQPHSEARYNLMIDLQQFKLKAGEYDLYLIYASGSLINEILGRSLILREQADEDAILFQGCIKSNRIKVQVE